VQLAPERPHELRQAALDRHVDVFVSLQVRELVRLELGGDGVQAGQELSQLVLGEHARTSQGSRVGS
jgi:hypothetical protein